MIKHFKRQSIKFSRTCTTGIACTLFKQCQAQKIHSFAGIGHRRGSKKVVGPRNVLTNKQYLDRWRNTDVLFIDEISMLRIERIFDIIQYITQNVRNSETFFGGRQYWT